MLSAHGRKSFVRATEQKHLYPHTAHKYTHCTAVWVNENSNKKQQRKNAKKNVFPSDFARTVATAHPDTRDSDARPTWTTARATSAPTTRAASTSSTPTAATAYRDLPASTARQKYPFAQRNTILAKTEADASTTRATTAASAQAVTPVPIALTTWMTAIIICAR